jgi:hypothetical protein
MIFGNIFRPIVASHICAVWSKRIELPFIWPVDMPPIFTGPIFISIGSLHLRFRHFSPEGWFFAGFLPNMYWSLSLPFIVYALNSTLFHCRWSVLILSAVSKRFYKLVRQIKQSAAPNVLFFYSLAFLTWKKIFRDVLFFNIPLIVKWCDPNFYAIALADRPMPEKVKIWICLALSICDLFTIVF